MIKSFSAVKNQMVDINTKKNVPLESIYLVGKRESMETDNYRSSQNNSILITSRPLS